jgi:hypothetical protein
MALASLRDVTNLLGTLVWPTVVIVALAIAISDRGRRLLAPVLRRIKAVSGPGGFGLSLSPETASATKSDVESGLSTYASALKRELDRLVGVEDVNAIMRQCARFATTGLDANTGYRATVHIPDVLYSDTLYQLLDYWPKGNGTSGRRFSERFGILGLAWRLEESQYADRVDPNQTSLVRDWGMTRDQASQAGAGRQSFVCIVVRNKGLPVGVLYFDAIPQRAFPADIVEKLENHQGIASLGDAIAGIRHEVAKSGPGLQLYQND